MKNIENLEDIFSKITQEKQECIANMSKHMGSEINDNQSVYDLLSKLAEEKGNVTDLDKKLDKSKIVKRNGQVGYTVADTEIHKVHTFSFNKDGWLLLSAGAIWSNTKPSFIGVAVKNNPEILTPVSFSNNDEFWADNVVELGVTVFTRINKGANVDVYVKHMGAANNRFVYAYMILED